MKAGTWRGFTLVELLVVVALVGGLAAVILVAGGGGKRTVALQAAQATLMNAVTMARTRAIASGATVRLLVHDSVASPFAFERYRRRLVVVEETGGGWRAVDEFKLPEGVYLIPYRTRVPAGMFAEPGEWRTADKKELLGSTALENPPMVFSYEGDVNETWEWVAFMARGTLDGAGAMIVAAGRWRVPGAEPAGSPVELIEPGSVRGMKLGNYGAPRLLNDRSGF